MMFPENSWIPIEWYTIVNHEERTIPKTKKVAKIALQVPQPNVHVYATLHPGWERVLLDILAAPGWICNIIS